MRYLNNLLVILLVVTVMLVIATPVMAQSRSHTSVYIGDGGVDFSYRSSSGDRSWGYSFETGRGRSDFSAFSRSDRGYLGYRADRYGSRLEMDSYGRHSSDFTLETRNRDRFRDDRWYRDEGYGGYVPHGAQRYRDDQCYDYRRYYYDDPSPRVIYVPVPAETEWRPRYVGEHPDGSVDLPPAPHITVVRPR